MLTPTLVLALAALTCALTAPVGAIAKVARRWSQWRRQGFRQSAC